MPTIASRITSTGQFNTNSYIDEVSYNPASLAKNLLQYSQNFSIGTPYWYNTVILNSTNNLAPDGTLSATRFTTTGVNLDLQYLYQPCTVTPGVTYTASFYAQLGTMTSVQYLFAIYNETALTWIAQDIVPTVTLTSAGWSRVTYTFTAPIGCTVARVYPFRNNSIGTAAVSFYVWGVQVELGTQATFYVATPVTTLPTGGTTRTDPTGIYYNTGGFDEVSYNAGTLTKNKFPTTSNLGSAFWGFNNGTITTNTTVSPDGTTTAATITGSSATVPWLSSTESIVTGITYTFSVYVKAGTQARVMMLLYGTNFNSGGANQSVTFDLSLGTIIATAASPQGYGIQNIGSGWYRIYITGTATTTVSDNMQLVRFQDGIYASGNYAYVWNPQCEIGTKPTFYVATPVITLPANIAKQDTAAGYTVITNQFDDYTWNPPIVTSNLVLNLDAANPNSYPGTDTTWTDLSNNGANGTLTSGTTYSFTNSGVITFNGTSLIATGQASLPSSYTNDFSCEAWIYIPSSYTWNTTNKVGVFHRGQYGGFCGLTSGIVNNQVCFSLRGTTGGSNGPNATITRDAWWHVVGTWTASSNIARIYLNGTSSSSVSFPSVDAPSGVWRIGNNTVEAAAATNYFTGNIAATKLYSVALTADQVKQNYNATKGRYGY